MFVTCMAIRLAIAFFSFVIILFTALFTSTGCANIIPPSGGPRDSLPPQLIKSTPADSSKNFSGNRITFTFDEYIEVQNIYSNLIVSPIPEENPTVDYRLNTMTVKFKDSLESNTTYSFNFGKAIKDYNEGNVLMNFSFVFSTGPALDSLELKGNVILAESGKTDSTLIAILHKREDDSALVKSRPRYMAKLDKEGSFVFKNLPAGKFYLYALQDQSGSGKYMDTKQLFAFADSPVIVQQGTLPVTLYAYAETAATMPGITTQRPRGGTAENRLRYQTSVSNSKQDILQPFKFVFETALKTFDSTKIRFTSDSTFQTVPGYSWGIDSTEKIVQLNFSWQENTLYHFIMEKDFAVDTTGKMLLKPDTISFRTNAKSDYGSLKLRLSNVDFSVNPVLQLLLNNEIKKSIPINSEEISEPLFIPGDYELRVLYDKNKNGKWDPGEFFGKHRQPEIVKPIDQRINVKPGTDNNFEIQL